MTTELITIVVREQGTRAAAGGIRRVERASRTAAGSVRLLTGALAGLGLVLSARELLELADTAVRLNNTIRVTTRGTEEFLAVQSELRRVAIETRTPIEDTVNIFRRLRIATRDLGSSQAEVIQVVEGLNAGLVLSGATATEARAALIQLSQGLASGRLQGDELRGVLENAAPVAQALADELGTTVGRLREMGAAGELNAQTIFPALLAISEDFTAQLGDTAFTVGQATTILRNRLVTVVDTMNQVLGATEGLSAGIVRFSDTLEEDVLTGVAALIEGFGEVLDTGASVLTFVNELGVERLPTLGQTLRTIAQSFLIFINAVETGIQAIRTGANASGAALRLVSFSLGLRSGEEVQEQVDAFNRSQEDLVASSLETRAAIERLGGTFAEIATEGGDTAAAGERFRELADSARGAAAALREARDTEGAPVDLGILQQRGPDRLSDQGPTQEELDEQAKALERLVDISDRLTIAERERSEPLSAEIERIRQQRVETEALARTAEDRIVSGKVLADLARAEAEIQERIREAAASISDEETRIAIALRSIREDSPELAEDLREAAEEARSGAEGIEDQAEALRRVRERAERIVERERDREGLAEDLAGDVTAGIGAALRSLREGEVVDFGQALADVSGDLLSTSLSDVLNDLQGELTDLLEQAASALGGEGFGGQLGQTIGAGLGLVGTLAAGALQSSDVAVSRANVGSAVTSTEQTRGVVAGQTSIPVFEVGDSLDAALTGTNDILAQILSVEQSIRGLLQQVASASATAGASNPLATTTPTLG